MLSVAERVPASDWSLKRPIRPWYDPAKFQGSLHVPREEILTLRREACIADILPMPLRIANSRTDRLAVDMTGVTPDALQSSSIADVQRTLVVHGNRQAELGELFAIDGDPRDTIWRLAGDFGAVHNLGAGMTAGDILVDGPVGRHAGARMLGGRLDIRGDAGDWLGAEMRHGQIRVRASAGHHVGAAYLGSARGMTGGAILIDGDVGDLLGERMRRGLIAVAGHAGDWLGKSLLAGTILVFGNGGAHAGATMRRGTIGLFGPAPPTLLPTFRYASRAELSILRLLERRLCREEFALQQVVPLARPVELYHADFLNLGRGEILTA
jgi:formylmethanofuran dehydrogenase subunit C